MLRFFGSLSLLSHSLTLCLHILKEFLLVYSCKQNGGVAKRLARLKHTELGNIGKLGLVRSNLREYSLRSFGNIRYEKSRGNSYGFKQVIKNSCKTRALTFVLSKHPRHSFIYIFIRPSEHGKYFFKRICHVILVHKLHSVIAAKSHLCLKLRVELTLLLGERNYAVEILLRHSVRTADEITEIVGKVVVVSRYNALVGNRAIVGIRHLGECIISYTVNTEYLGKLISKHDVTARFAHLISSEIKPRMTKDLFGKRKLKCHKENRPINSMESQNILAYNMHVCGPIFLEMLTLLFKALVRIVTDSGNIIRQSVKPYVYDVLVVEINGNSPLE